MNTRILSVLVILGAFSAGSCGGSTPSGVNGGTGGTGGGGGGGGATDNCTGVANCVAVGDNLYTPSAKTVPVNTLVEWRWNGSAPHDVAFNDGPASAQQTSGSFSRSFTAAGTYPYHCRVHGTAMSGTIVVQ